MTGHRDLVIRELAAGEAERLDECRELASDLHITREMLIVALDEIATLSTRLSQAKDTIIHLHEELRRYSRNAVLGRVA